MCLKSNITNVCLKGITGKLFWGHYTVILVFCLQRCIYLFACFLSFQDKNLWYLSDKLNVFQILKLVGMYFGTLRLADLKATWNPFEYCLK